MAQETIPFWSSEGDAYLGALNSNGAVLTSKYPKEWFDGEPSGDHLAVEQNAVIFLCQSCDALHSHYGAGTWSWWNDNFTATFGGHSIGFVNQELFDHGRFADCADQG